MFCLGFLIQKKSELGKTRPPANSRIPENHSRSERNGAIDPALGERSIGILLVPFWLSWLPFGSFGLNLVPFFQDLS